MRVIYLPEINTGEAVIFRDLQQLDDDDVSEAGEGMNQMFSLWEFGEVREIDEEETITVHGEEILLIDYILNCNDFKPFIPEYLRGVLINYNYHCDRCGTYSPCDYFIRETQIESQTISLWHDNVRYCQPCYEKDFILTPNGYQLKRK